LGEISRIFSALFVDKRDYHVMYRHSSPLPSERGFNGVEDQKHGAEWYDWASLSQNKLLNFHKTYRLPFLLVDFDFEVL
jgi:hypothetical protein